MLDELTGFGTTDLRRPPGNTHPMRTRYPSQQPETRFPPQSHSRRVLTRPWPGITPTHAPAYSRQIDPILGSELGVSERYPTLPSVEQQVREWRSNRLMLKL